MKKIKKDIKKCFKFSLALFSASFLIGVIVGTIYSLIEGGVHVVYILKWGVRVVTYASSFGLFISAISFAKKDLMRPLNYEKQWKTYFGKLNLAQAIFFICVFSLFYSITIDSILFYF